MIPRPLARFTFVAGFTALAFGLGVPGALAAQGSPLSLRLSGGGSLATGGFTRPVPLGGEVGAGASFGAHFVYRTGPRAGLRLGFSQHRFGCEEGACPEDGQYVHTGWDLGARVGPARQGLRPFIQIGAVFARVERDFERDDRIERGVSDLSVGGEVGLGVTVPLKGRLALEPAGRWVWMNTRFPGEGLLRMRWLVLDVGLEVGF